MKHHNSRIFRIMLTMVRYSINMQKIKNKQAQSNFDIEIKLSL